MDTIVKAAEKARVRNFIGYGFNMPRLSPAGATVFGDGDAQRMALVFLCVIVDQCDVVPDYECGNTGQRNRQWGTHGCRPGGTFIA